jgi:hypothetical protein
VLAVTLVALSTTIGGVVANSPEADASTIAGTITRGEMMSRAKFWLGAVYYNQGLWYSDPDGNGHYYRADCSGFVSMVWHLNGSPVTGSSGNTGAGTLPAVSTRLGSIYDLQPGDALIKLGVGNAGHARLFRYWGKDGRAYVYELSGGSYVREASYSAAELGAYTPYRYRNVASSGPFTDVAPSYGFSHEIRWMLGRGITVGYDNGWTYRPNSAIQSVDLNTFFSRLNGVSVRVSTSSTYITRGEFALAMFKKYGSAKYGPAFTDVPSSSPYYNATRWMRYMGYTTGYSDGTFRPGQYLVRGDTAAFLYRMFSYS